MTSLVDYLDGSLTVPDRPTVETLEYEQYGWEGQSRNFTCVGHGNPLPQLRWFRESQLVLDSDVYSRTDEVGEEEVVSTLQVRDWDFLECIC